MKTIDPHDDLKEGWEPSQMPPVPGPGALPPQPPVIPERPSLCRFDCTHYHRLVMQADAADPQEVEIDVDLPESRFARRQPNGRMLVRSLPVIHDEVEHYCYPSSGIEIVIGSTPVVECSRYSPEGAPDNGGRRAYDAAVGRWRADYAALQKEANAFDEALAAAMAAKEKTP